MSTITQFILEQEGNFTLRPGQHLHLRHRTGSSTTIGSRIKAGILGEPRPGLNSKFFLFTDVISLAENVISWQSTGGADRYTCRTPHFLMHSRCTLVSMYRAISRTRVAQDWTGSQHAATCNTMFTFLVNFVLTHFLSLMVECENVTNAELLDEQFRLHRDAATGCLTYEHFRLHRLVSNPLSDQTHNLCFVWRQRGVNTQKSVSKVGHRMPKSWMGFPLHSGKGHQQGRLDGVILTLRPRTMKVLRVCAARQDVSES